MARPQVIILVSLLLLPLAFHRAIADHYEASDHATKDHEASSDHATSSDSDEAFNHATDKFDGIVTTKVHREKKYVIEGMVYCQSCKDWETSSVYGDPPIPYAKVSVTCKNHRDQVFYEKEYTANYYGYFRVELEGYSVVGHIGHLFAPPLHSCKVKLVSSPVKSCNVASTLNNGNTGASLHREIKKYAKKNCDYEEVYAAGPLAFHSALCIHY